MNREYVSFPVGNGPKGRIQKDGTKQQVLISSLGASQMFNGREILLGVTGGIAAYKSADLASKLVQAGAHVSVILTPAAEQFIGATTFEALTGRPVNRGLFSPNEHFQGEHIGLARRAEILIIAPATADFLAKLALGLSDDLLSTTALVATCPVLVAPAMNSEMWAKPAVQRNVATIKADGIQVVEPGSGWLSCGQVGAGRMAETETILKSIQFTSRGA